MPTKRKRKAHSRRPEISTTALYHASDGLWGDLENVDVFDGMTYGYPTVCPDECREVWLAIRDELLPQWIREFPGTRPSWWYLFDSERPRLSADDIRRHGWEGCFFVEFLPDLRRRLGGVGDPIYEHQAYVPALECAVPVHFVSVEDVDFYRRQGEKFAGKPIDPNDPPKYESQAAYLKRHRLLTSSEIRRLRKSDYDPETVGRNQEQRKGTPPCSNMETFTN